MGLAPSMRTFSDLKDDALPSERSPPELDTRLQ